jgi:hypothetical protein
VLSHGAFRCHGYAECFLVDAEELLDEWSILYVPVVNLTKIRPDGRAMVRDFIYLASYYRPNGTTSSCASCVGRS